MYFLRKIIFHFASRKNIIFSRKRNAIFSDDTRKIPFQCDFFGKNFFLEHLEKENMSFRAVRFCIIIVYPTRICTIYLVLYIMKRIYVFYFILFYSVLFYSILFWKNPDEPEISDAKTLLKVVQKSSKVLMFHQLNKRN